MRARKKPVEVEVFQMTEESRRDLNTWPSWLHKAWNEDAGAPGSLFPDPRDSEWHRLCIGTLEGSLEVSWDDWIIQGVEGEIYPCKPSIFEKTYDLVEEET